MISERTLIVTVNVVIALHGTPFDGDVMIRLLLLPNEEEETNEQFSSAQTFVPSVQRQDVQVTLESLSVTIASKEASLREASKDASAPSSSCPPSEVEEDGS
jgi:hypothetical protein